MTLFPPIWFIFSCLFCKCLIYFHMIFARLFFFFFNYSPLVIFFFFYKYYSLFLCDFISILLNYIHKWFSTSFIYFRWLFSMLFLFFYTCFIYSIVFPVQFLTQIVSFNVIFSWAFFHLIYLDFSPTWIFSPPDSLTLIWFSTHYYISRSRILLNIQA